MGFVVAALVAVAGVIAASVKEGAFKNDTTYRDTVAFEKRVLEERLARVRSRHREVVELGSGVSRESGAKETARLKRLEAKIAELAALEKEKGWN